MKSTRVLSSILVLTGCLTLRFWFFPRHQSPLPSHLQAEFTSQKWVKNFADAKTCSEWILDPDERKPLFASQFRQDYVLYNAIFESNPTDFRGTYIDLAAFHPRDLSNSFFFDICLGWNGLCIEGSSKNWPAFKSERNCRLVQHCVSNRDEERIFVGDGMSAGLEGYNKVWGDDKDTKVKMECKSMKSILADNGIQHVHYFSLDVEGAEMLVLEGIDFSKVTIDVFTIEENVERVVEYLEDRGYQKVMKLHEDVYMVHNSTGYADKILSWTHSFDQKCVQTMHAGCVTWEIFDWRL